MFCPKCKSLMLPKAGKIACGCGYKQSGEVLTLKESSKTNAKEVSVIDKEETINPIVEIECEKCKNTKAENWEIQTRSSDEPATRFFRCTKCKHTWREYK